MTKPQYNDFEEFIKINKLKKNTLAEYLNVSAAFITQVAQGQRKLPKDKLTLILTNKEWKTYMLTTNQPTNRTEDNQWSQQHTNRQ